MGSGLRTQSLKLPRPMMINKSLLVVSTAWKKIHICLLLQFQFFFWWFLCFGGVFNHLRIFTVFVVFLTLGVSFFVEKNAGIYVQVIEAHGFEVCNAVLSQKKICCWDEMTTFVLLKLSLSHATRYSTSRCFFFFTFAFLWQTGTAALQSTNWEMLWWT
jgi:hypothetical protein